MNDYMGYRPIRIGKLETSKIELFDIAKAWIAISLAFAFLLSGRSLFNLQFLFFFFISMVTVGVGFLFHELAHKVSAQRYGCVAEFRAQDSMLLFMLVLAFFTGFIFAAPGAVMIAGRVTTKENGIISAVGPATNFVLSVVFLGLAFVLPLGGIWWYGFQINAWLGLFNLIPVWNLDGKKVLNWNLGVYVSLVVVGLVMVFWRFLFGLIF